MLLLLMHQLFNVYKTEKRISIYRRYVYNFGQSDSNLFANYTYTEIVIVPIMVTDLFGY